jgi:5-deoxy-glucuronate isomerase
MNSDDALSPASGLETTISPLGTTSARVHSALFVEVDLEEIYDYRVDRPEGYAIQKVYTADRRIDQTLSVRDGELVLIREGYHPVVAAHGYNVYYLNALAGSARSMAASDDPDYAWVRDTWREQDPRVPLVGS